MSLQIITKGLATWGTPNDILCACGVSNSSGEMVSLSTSFAFATSRENAIYVALSQVEHGGFALAFDWE